MPETSQQKHRRLHRERINARNRERYTTDGRWEKQLKTRFNITPEEYWRIWKKQNGLCKICRKP